MSASMPVGLGTGSWCDCSSSPSCVEGFHEFQNHANDRLITNRRVDHSVVNSTVRPFDVKILLDEIGALPINSVHELFSFLFTLAASQQAPHFFFSRSIKK